MTRHVFLNGALAPLQPERSGTRWCWVVLLGITLAFGLPAAMAAGEVKGKIGYELDGKKYASPRAACEAYAAETRAYFKIAASDPLHRFQDVKDNGADGFRCILSNSDGGPAYSEGGFRTATCPSNSVATHSELCTCDDGFSPSGSECVAMGTPGRLPTPAERGMTDVDDVVFQGIARNRGLFIIVRDSNSAAPSYFGKPGYLPKPEKLKAKSKKEPPYVGLVTLDPNDKDVIEFLQSVGLSYEELKLELKKQVPSLLVKDDQTYRVYSRLVVKGKKVDTFEEVFYFSDYDMHGVYDRARRPAFKNPEFRKMMNARFKNDMVQHGAHDDWPKNMEPGLNCGPQKRSTAYLPTGEVVHLPELKDLEAFYRKHKLPWDSIYGKYGSLEDIKKHCESWKLKVKK